MKIRVTRKIEANGKVEDDSIEAEYDGLSEDVTSMTRALFESMDTPMIAVKQCFHYSNLQPLRHTKSNRMPASHQAELL